MKTKKCYGCGVKIPVDWIACGGDYCVYLKELQDSDEKDENN